MNIDYHTHHERCGHAAGTLRDYVERAIEIGLQQIGLSDHMPLFHIRPEEYLPEVAMPMAELANYVEECYNLKREYKQQIDIRVGLEADYIEGHEREIERILAEFEWDYVIGSVHFIGDQNEWDITDYRRVHLWHGKQTDDVYRQFYDKVAKSAQCGLFDIIGHVDAIKRFGIQSSSSPVEWERAALETIKASDLTIEFNTAGWQAKATEPYPSARMLQYACELGIPITLGSDAHQPAHLMRDFAKARIMLKDVGYRQLATFAQRQRQLVELQ
jgi:histidinol-phosphatase (PHP family)